MDKIQVARVQGTLPRRIPFVSTCPKCTHNQVQWYTRGALTRLIDHGHPVEAYCAICDQYWEITAYDRDSLAAQLTG